MLPVLRTLRILLLNTGASKHAVVVGGGWGGFGAAYALLKAGVKVTVLDASETPGGLSSGWRTPGGRSVEAGIKGYGCTGLAAAHRCKILQQNNQTVAADGAQVLVSIQQHQCFGRCSWH